MRRQDAGTIPRSCYSLAFLFFPRYKFRNIFDIVRQLTLDEPRIRYTDIVYPKQDDVTLPRSFRGILKICPMYLGIIIQVERTRVK